MGSPMQVLFLYPSVPDTQNLEHELKTFSLRIEFSQVGSLVHPVVFPLPQTSGTNFSTEACL